MSIVMTEIIFWRRVTQKLDSDESDVYELEAMLSPPSPSQLSARDCRTHGLYGCACNTRLYANAVHAAS